jgi:hypothetical protein
VSAKMPFVIVWVVLVACLPGGTERRMASGPTGWSVDSLPVLDLQATTPDGRTRFGSAIGAVRLANGHLVIADGAESGIRFFDSTGQLIRTVGRHGSGPKEFQAIAWLGRCGGDSLYVWDRGLARMSVLDRAGTVIRQFGVQPMPTTLACSPSSGEFAFLGPAEATAGSLAEIATARYQAPLFVADRLGRVVRRLGTVAAGEPRPLGRVTRLGITVREVLLGTADSAAVDVYTLPTGRITTLQLGLTPRRPTQRHLERAVDAQAAILPDAADRAAVRQMMLRMPMPDWLPAYRDVFIDESGRCWVQLSVPGDGDTRLGLLGRDGRISTELRLPIELTVFALGPDYVLGVYEDADGESHVAHYRVHHS